MNVKPEPPDEEEFQKLEYPGSFFSTLTPIPSRVKNVQVKEEIPQIIEHDPTLKASPGLQTAGDDSGKDLNHGSYGNSDDFETESDEDLGNDVCDVLNLLDCDESDNDNGGSSSESGDDTEYRTEENENSETDVEDNDDSSDDEPLAQLADRTKARKRPNYRWRKKQFDIPDTTFTGPEIVPPSSMEVDTPLRYFRRFISDEMLALLAEQTNLYSVQKNGKPVATNKKELEQVIGMFFHMGLVQMPNTRMYWERATAYEPVSSVMSRNRFQLLLTVLHFVDNLTVTDDKKKGDKLWKIRLWLTQTREACLRVIPEEYNSVGEMMCQYKGRTSTIRQYLKSKPHPWGFKIWGRTGISGMLYDFDVYQGGDGKRSELGQGADVVLKLTSTLQRNVNYKIFADNLFTGVTQIQKMMENGMHYVGTVRKNRVPNCILEDEKNLKKRGRGAYDFSVEQNLKISAVTCYDNRAVTLLSSYLGVEPVGEATRWDKKAKAYKKVTMPAVIREYNTFMGGIDKLDSFLAKYRFRMKSRRWYLYLFWHFIMVSLVNAWIWYRRDFVQLKLPTKSVMKRRHFQAAVASALINANAERRRGRPSMDSREVRAPPKRVCQVPVDDIRKDNYAHWPEEVEKRGRCRNCGCSQTNTQCAKCQVRLCYVRGRNCFVAFHT